MTRAGPDTSVVLHSPSPAGEKRAAVVFLPGIGVSAQVVAPLAEHLPDLEVVVVGQRPTAEPKTVDVHTRAEATAEALSRVSLPDSVVVVGHSIGAVLGLELVHVLQRNRPGLVRCLVVAAQVAPDRLPHHGADYYTDEVVLGHVLGDRALPPELAGSPDFVRMLVTGWRADYLQLDGYRPDGRVPVPVDLHVWTGTEDPVTTDPADVAGWQRCSSATVTSRRFPGGHGFLFHDPARTAREILSLVE